MALIKCPNCGAAISDQADRCVHCGWKKTDGHTMRRCRECGIVISEAVTVCPNCGCPQEEHVSSQSRKKSSVGKKIIKILYFLVLVGLVVTLVGLLHGEIPFESEGAYWETVDQVLEAQNVSVDPVNACSTLLMDVWNNCIWHEYDETTDPFTCPNGVFFDDFNDAMDLLYEDAAFQFNLEVIEQQRTELISLRAKLQDPPEDAEELNEALIRLIDNHIETSALIMHPYGSYADMRKRFSTLSEENRRLITRLDILFAEN